MSRPATSLRPAPRLAKVADLPKVSSSDLKNQIGVVLDDARTTGFVLTRRNEPEFVVLPSKVYENILRHIEVSLADLDGEFDALVASMGTTEAKAGVEALFNATPAQLGGAALAAVSKHAQHG